MERWREYNLEKWQVGSGMVGYAWVVNRVRIKTKKDKQEPQYHPYYWPTLLKCRIAGYRNPDEVETYLSLCWQCWRKGRLLLWEMRRPGRLLRLLLLILVSRFALERKKEMVRSMPSMFFPNLPGTEMPMLHLSYKTGLRASRVR